MTAFIIAVLIQSLFMALVGSTHTNISEVVEIWSMAMAAWSIVMLIDIL